MHPPYPKPSVFVTSCLIALMPIVAMGQVERISDPSSQFGGYFGRGIDFAADGSIYAVSAGQAVNIHDAETSELLSQVFVDDTVTALALSSDGSLLLAGKEDGRIEIWNLSTGSPTVEFDVGSGSIQQIDLSDDDRYLITVISSRSRAQLHDASTGEFVREFAHIITTVIPGDDDEEDRVITEEYRVLDAALSPDGVFAVTGGRDGRTRVWSVANGLEVRTFVQGTGSPTTEPDVLTVDYSPSGLFIASGGDGNRAVVWNFATSQPVARLTLHNESVTDVEFSRDSRRLMTGSEDNDALIWDLSSSQVFRFLQASFRDITDVALSPDQSIALTSNTVGRTFVWDVERERTDLSYFGPDELQTAIAVSPDGTRLATSSFDNDLWLWSAEDGAVLQTISGHAGDVNDVQFHPLEDQIFSASDDASARLWDLPEERVFRGFATDGSGLSCIDVSADGTRIAAGDFNGTVWFWNTVSEARLQRLEELSDFVTSVAIGTTSERIAAADDDSNILVWNFEGDLIARMDSRLISGNVSSIDLSDDGATLVAGQSNGTVSVWDVDTESRLTVFDLRQQAVTSVAFAPDESAVLVGTRANQMHIFDVQVSRELRVFGALGNDVLDVAYAPDGLTAYSLTSLAGFSWPAVPGCSTQCADDTTDSDGDGLSDCYEECVLTDKFDRDTDGDGMPDDYETFNYLLRLVADDEDDRDFDGLTNLEEMLLGLLPWTNDSDLDGMLDGYEVDNELDPLANDADADLDEDGLTNREEFNEGTNANDPDTDDDGMLDRYEVIFGLNPTLDDGAIDRDGDGLSNLVEHDVNLDPLNNDTDGDGLFDGYEVENGLDPFRLDSEWDTDGDTLTNIQEFNIGSDPNDIGDPPVPLHVNAATGDDIDGTGKEDSPLLTISAALINAARFSYLLAPTIQVAPGEYQESIELGFNVTLNGSGPETILRSPSNKNIDFIETAEDTVLSNLTVTASEDLLVARASLIKIGEGPFLMDRVNVEGQPGQSITGVEITSGVDAGSRIQNSTFRDLATGIAGSRGSVQVGACLFDNISDRAIHFTRTTSFLSPPILGDSRYRLTTGFNRFRNPGNAYVELLDTGSAFLNARYNDWGVYDPDLVPALFQQFGNVSDDRIVFDPIQGEAILDGDVYILLSRRGTTGGFDFEDNARVIVDGSEFLVDDQSFARVRGFAAGVLTVQATADDREVVERDIKVFDPGINVLEIVLGPAPADGEGALEGEGAGEEPEGEIDLPNASALLLSLYPDADGNRDGVVTVQEARNTRLFTNAEIDALDSNGDGLVRVGELRTLLESESPVHTADSNANGIIDLSEMMRVLQLYNSGGYLCAVRPGDSEDGYILNDGPGLAPDCPPHDSDYSGAPNGQIDLTETLRIIQLYRFGRIARCSISADRFCES